MSLNLFGKTYLAADYLYDNGYNRIVFSADRNQADYLNYDSLEFPGLNANVILSTSSIYDIVGDGKDYETIAHYIKHLFDNGVEARIFADNESWLPIFFSWIKIAFPNITENEAFILYNLIKQREDLVFPDDRDFKSFMASRLYARNNSQVLNKVEFIEAHNNFNANDTTTNEYYTEVRDALRNDLPIEIQLAAYLSGDCDISIISEKIKRLGSKIVFNLIDDLKDHIRENIMTEKVRAMTGINLSWEDQNWEETLIAKSPDMAFLFDSSAEALTSSSEYRLNNSDNAISWCQWVLDNSTEEEKTDPFFGNIIIASEWIINHKDCLSSNTEIAHTASEAFIQEELNYSGTTLAFQYEYQRDRINTFWIEYVYQMAKANDIEGLRKVSHT